MLQFVLQSELQLQLLLLLLQPAVASLSLSLLLLSLLLLTLNTLDALPWAPALSPDCRASKRASQLSDESPILAAVVEAIQLDSVELNCAIRVPEGRQLANV